jgi:NADH:ubiquinone oxidoreductase subunit 5 (subunit L)/multisubunit Na+/H+ antiporter MnhA subunit
MFSHGVSTGGLFVLVGLLYERRHTRLIREFGGLATSLPVFSTFFLIVTLSSLGLPMLNGFVGEFLVILGSFHQRAVYAALAAVGVVLAAVYLLWMYQRVFLGEITNDKNKTLPDCSALEKFILATVVVVILAMGIYPQPFLRRMDHSVDAIMSRVLGTGNREQGLGIRGQGPGSRSPRGRITEFGIADGARGTVNAGNSPASRIAARCSPFPNPYSLIPNPYSLLPIPSVGVGR